VEYSGTRDLHRAIPYRDGLLREPASGLEQFELPLVFVPLKSKPIWMAGWTQRLLWPFHLWTRMCRAMGATAPEGANCAGMGNGRNTLNRMPSDPFIIVVSGLWIWFSRMRKNST
jgi:hypothetical protein